MPEYTTYVDNLMKLNNIPDNVDIYTSNKIDDLLATQDKWLCALHNGEWTGTETGYKEDDKYNSCTITKNDCKQFNEDLFGSDIPIDIKYENMLVYEDGLCKKSPYYGVKTLCDLEQSTFDVLTGSCVHDSNYCWTKAQQTTTWQDPISGEEISDCKPLIPSMAQGAIPIISMTQTAAAYKAFSMDNYSKCSSNETDTGFFCDSMTCPEGTQFSQTRGLLCYEKCKDGYEMKTDGTCVIAGCPNGLSDDGALTCWKPPLFLPAKHNLQCPPGTHAGVGAIDGVGICYEDCNKIAQEKGLSGNWIDSTAGLCKQGDCPDGWTDDPAKNSCLKNTYTRPPKPMTCPDGQFQDGLLCYNNCKPGYSRSALGMCMQNENCPDGWRDDGLFCGKNLKTVWSTGPLVPTCPPGKTLGGGLCYDNCPPDQSFDKAGTCWSDCPNNYTNTGLLCTKPMESIKKDCCCIPT